MLTRYRVKACHPAAQVDVQNPGGGFWTSTAVSEENCICRRRESFSLMIHVPTFARMSSIKALSRWIPETPTSEAASLILSVFARGAEADARGRILIAAR